VLTSVGKLLDRLSFPYNDGRCNGDEMHDFYFGDHFRFRRGLRSPSKHETAVIDRTDMSREFIFDLTD
jgi:hypothetical protein